MVACAKIAACHQGQAAIRPMDIRQLCLSVRQDYFSDLLSRGASREGVPGIQPKRDCTLSSVPRVRVLMIDIMIEAAIITAVTSSASSMEII